MQQVETNVVYGMYSGLALLLDVYRPAEPNGYGIVHVSGSGWHSPLAYNAVALKDLPQTSMYAGALQRAGYTVFAINHRAASRFRYPAAIEDAQRAVRFARANPERFGLTSDRIGASGGSSGGNIVCMLGTSAGEGNNGDADPVNRASAAVQCVVARAAPCDLLKSGGPAVASFLGALIRPDSAEPNSIESRLYREASPLLHLSNGSPPFLLIHGDADSTVPFSQSETMYAALQSSGVPAKLLCIPGGEHGADFPGAVNPPDYLGEMVAWFDLHLRQSQV